MRQHIRTDTIKMFDTDEIHIQAIMKKYNISNRSEAHRKALELCASLGDLVSAIHANTMALNLNTEKTEQMYFVAQEFALLKE